MRLAILTMLAGLIVGGLAGPLLWREVHNSPSVHAVSPTLDHTVSTSMAQSMAESMDDVMAFDPPRMELGDVPWYSEIPFSFRFRNDSGRPQRVEVVRAGCGCTLLSDTYHDRVINPGDAIEISGFINTAHQIGRFEREVEVMLAAGAIHRAIIGYNTVASWQISPHELDLGVVDVGSDEVYTSERTAVFRSERAVLLEPAVADAAWLSAHTVPLDDSATQIVVRVDPRLLPIGENMSRVHFSVDDSTNSEAVLRVKATGVAQLMPDERHVFLQPGESGKVSFLDAERQVAQIAAVESFGVVRAGHDRHVVTFECAEFTGETTYVKVVDHLGRRARVLVTCVKGEPP